MKLKRDFSKFELIKTIILLACTLVSGGMLFYYMRTSFFNVHDDLYEYCLVVNGEAFSSILGAAKEQGRILFLFTNFLEIVPMLAQSMMVYKCFAYASVVAAALTLWLVVRKHINSDVAWLSVIFYLAFSQLDSQHNSLVAYILWRQIDIIFCMLGIDCFLNYLKSECVKRSQLLLSALFYIMAALCYENYILFGIVYFGLSCGYYLRRKEFKVIKVLKSILPHIVVALVYVIMYFVWAKMYPSTYEGTQVDSSIDVLGSGIAMVVYSFGKFPGLTAGRVLISENHMYADYFASQTSVFDVMQMVLIVVSFVTVMVGLKKSDINSPEDNAKKTIETSMLWQITALCVGSALLLNALISVTAKYKNWVLVNGAYSYVSTNASFMFLCVVLATWAIYLFERIPFKKTYLVVVSVMLMFLSTLTNVSNDSFADGSSEITERYEAFDAFVRSDRLEVLGQNSQVYIPEFESFNTLDEDLEKYTEGIAGKVVDFSQSENNIDWNKKVYYYYYDINTNSYTWEMMN